MRITENLPKLVSKITTLVTSDNANDLGSIEVIRDLDCAKSQRKYCTAHIGPPGDNLDFLELGRVTCF